jgi:hypothetical protein
MTGFNSKRKMAADKLHWSDCAVHNGPAYPAGKCDCGVAQEPINLLEARKIAAEYGTPDSQIDSGNLYFALSKCLEHIDAQPAQEPVAFESFLESQDFYELMQTYRHCLNDALLPFEEVKDALRAAHIGSKP